MGSDLKVSVVVNIMRQVGWVMVSSYVVKQDADVSVRMFLDVINI